MFLVSNILANAVAAHALKHSRVLFGSHLMLYYTIISTHDIIDEMRMIFSTAKHRKEKKEKEKHIFKSW
jgi:hypothetical protein